MYEAARFKLLDLDRGDTLSRLSRSSPAALSRNRFETFDINHPKSRTIIRFLDLAIKVAAAIVERLPKDTCSPETTEGKQGFLHPIGISGALEKATLGFIVRDFTDQGLKEKEALLESIVKAVMKDFPRSTYRLEIKPQYRNMKQVIDRHPKIVDYAIEAIRRAGLRPVKSSIRGGTDGSRLSFMGLPCPNIFAGEHAFHSRLEWVSVQDMEKAVQTIVHLAMIWEEQA